MSNDAAEPVLRVSVGTPDDEELAALLVVLSGLAAPAEPAPPQPQPSRWADRARGIGTTPRPGPGAWMASARPH